VCVYICIYIYIYITRLKPYCIWIVYFPGPHTHTHTHTAVRCSCDRRRPLLLLIRFDQSDRVMLRATKYRSRVCSTLDFFVFPATIIRQVDTCVPCATVTDRCARCSRLGAEACFSVVVWLQAEQRVRGRITASAEATDTLILASHYLLCGVENCRKYRK
jgi:hypothetical protein